MSTLSLPERLTIAEARATLAQLQPALQAAAAVEVDAAPLKELDSAAVAVLLACLREARAQGKAFTLSGAPAKLRDLARMYGVNGLLGL